MAPPATPLARARHVKYFLRCLQGLPYDYISADVNRCDARLKHGDVPRSGLLTRTAAVVAVAWGTH